MLEHKPSQDWMLCFGEQVCLLFWGFQLWRGSAGPSRLGCYFWGMICIALPVWYFSSTPSWPHHNVCSSERSLISYLPRSSRVLHGHFKDLATRAATTQSFTSSKSRHPKWMSSGIETLRSLPIQNCFVRSYHGVARISRCVLLKLIWFLSFMIKVRIIQRSPGAQSVCLRSGIWFMCRNYVSIVQYFSRRLSWAFLWVVCVLLGVLIYYLTSRLP